MSIESLTPLTREELFLEKIIGGDVDIPTPKQRIELFLAKIAGENVELPVPATRTELFLASIAGEDVVLPEPATREEMFLGSIAGMDIELPEPKTREEWYLYQWAESGTGVLKTVSGAIIHITDALKRSAKKVLVNIEPVQSGSGDPSPTNVRPITGWTGANIKRTGKNLMVANTSGSGTSRTIEFTYNSDGTYTVSGGTTTGVVLADANRVDMAVTLPAGTYTVSCNNDHDLYLWVYNNITKKALCVARDGYKTFTFTLTEETEIATTLTASSGAEVSDGTNYIQIEAGSTATAFEPYQGVTYSVAFPTETGTVYNGTLDVTSGVLTVTSVGLDLDDANWVSTTYDNVFRTSAAVGKKAGYNNFLCSNYKTTNAALTDMGNNTIRGHATNATSIYIKDERYETVDDFAAALEDCYIVYEIAQPIIYTLTPTEVRMLLGENYVWADTGNTELMYLASE